MISIVTVNYNSRDLLRNCLRSIEEHVRVPYEVIVVDNSSSDGSTVDLPCEGKVKILFQNTNLGFSKGCNRGARAATGTVLHFLNPDTQVDGSINAAYETALKAEKNCTFTTKLANVEGKIEKTSHVIPTLKNMYNLFVAPDAVERWHIGASILVSPETFWNVGGFSEDYFMYWEDIDFFYKCIRADIPNTTLPTVITHHKGGCSRNVWSTWQRLKVMEQSGLAFSEKFDLRLDYFVFKHLAFFRNVILHPVTSFMGLEVYWAALLSRVFVSRSILLHNER
ncbi:MAG: glycosyltransferase family 2 protein [Bdellovibrionales bacterium]|nr:glycosyltransferase family 2 protein [Bdellovibrionales bacterium]